MNNSGVLRRYALMQLPGYGVALAVLLIVHSFTPISIWIYLAVITGMIVKDILLFPFLKDAYAGCEANAGGMAGLKGNVIHTLSPEGSVIVRGEIWQARADIAGLIIEKSAPVRITGIKGLMLLVEPCFSDDTGIPEKEEAG